MFKWLRSIFGGHREEITLEEIARRREWMLSRLESELGLKPVRVQSTYRGTPINSRRLIR